MTARQRGSWNSPLLAMFPRHVRVRWSPELVKEGHARYTHSRQRDPMTVALESEYQRRSRRRRRYRVVAAELAAS